MMSVFGRLLDDLKTLGQERREEGEHLPLSHGWKRGVAPDVWLHSHHGVQLFINAMALTKKNASFQ
jgi:hypothetical protein